MEEKKKAPPGDKQKSHFFPVTFFPLRFLITLKYFFWYKDAITWEMYCALLNFFFTASLVTLRKEKKKEMVRANAAGCPAPSSIPIKLDELEVK